MSRAFNFSAGPATLPESVLVQVQEELLEWQGERASVLEVSHRGKAFIDCAAQAEADLRHLLGVGDDYAVLFLQGGATTVSALLPMNLARADQTGEYLLTGHWGEKALENAKTSLNTHIVASDKANAYRNIPGNDSWQRAGNAAYFHYTSNETIHGVEFADIPDVGDVPLVADFSSNFLARPVDVNRFGMIYAGAQKNLGPAGITIAVIRKDLLGRHERDLPPIFEWQNQVKNDSMFNTPPTFPWYVVGLVLKWMIAEGGTEVFARRNAEKAALLYRTIDGSGGFYRNEVAVSARSTMNVPFILKDEALDKAFLKESETAGLMGLKGHRALGGMRASVYNAMPLSGVQALADFMGDFAVRHG
ncbi:MAG: 3-phosphoserine/phosphohydroxythreonine transaminase [Xanthomonadaceae bacterium]|jgi:phosphoserine aminotransferase|nr:3-phosphoserine/phosphohydroxythreonine transaminase [Xanthomonadaceae bacterium]